MEGLPAEREQDGPWPGPLTEEYEGDRVGGVNACPSLQCSATQLIYAVEMQSCTLGLHKCLKGFKNDGRVFFVQNNFRK